MKVLRDRREIALALNFGKCPELSIDLSECDEYGLKGSICKIDFGTFSSYVCCLHNDYSYSYFTDDVAYAEAPIVYPESEIAVAVYNSNKREAYGLLLVEIGNIHKHCSTPMSCIDAYMTDFIKTAEIRYGLFGK